jgi:hypothetical protein
VRLCIFMPFLVKWDSEYFFYNPVGVGSYERKHWRNLSVDIIMH